jgi:hypothetical protein
MTLMSKDKSKVKTTAFASVFQQKLDKLIDRIKTEYKKPKAERDKASLKRMAKEAKELRDLLKECNVTMKEVECPKCGHEFKVVHD